MNPSPATPEPDQHRTGLELDRAGLIAFCRDLVRARSVHDPAAGLTELPAAELVAAKMREFGWEPRIEEVAPGRPNVLAFVAGGGGDGPAIAFVGHTDVVTEGQLSDWTVDPYGGEIRDGRLYGRGAADMKSGLAAAIFAVRALQLAGPFPGRIVLCALADEEGLMLGAKHLAASGLLAGVAGAIVCEPEGGEICPVAKGAIRLRLDLHGAMAHGAMPHLGRNPVHAAGLLLAEIDRLQAQTRAENSMPADGVDTVSFTPTALLAGNAEQLNVIPAHAIIYLDIRTTPVIDHGRLLTRIADLAGRVTAPAGIGVTITVIDDRPPVQTSREHPVVAALSAAHQRIHGQQAPFGIVPGTTDGTILTRDAGLPTVVYGPGGKWIAHQADEFVELAEIEHYALVYAEAARVFLSGASAEVSTGASENESTGQGQDEVPRPAGRTSVTSAHPAGGGGKPGRRNYAALFELTGRHALVVGAGSGIGRESSIALAAFGARLSCADLDLARARETAELAGPGAVGYPLDMLDETAIRRAAAELGDVDILVFTAATNVRKRILDYSAAEAERVTALNLSAPFALIRAFGAAMVAHGSGSIIGFTSIRAMTTEPGQAMYAATKAALVQMLRTAAAEWGPAGVRVNLIAPGVVETPLTAQIQAVPQWYDAYADKSVLGRWASADEMAGAVVYLASDAASYVTGSVLLVDGGWTAADGRYTPPA